MSRNQPVLVVGAGFAGAVYARILAESDIAVHVIDKRPHVAGNAYDEIGQHGIRIHKYGPHLFHTSNTRVLEFIRNYAEWIPYTHRVRAWLPSGQLVPLPINLDTMNAVFETDFAQEISAREYLSAIAIPNQRPGNAAEYLASKIGSRLTDLFFRPYSKKMWQADLEDLDASIVKRLPLRFDRIDTYFDQNQTQLLPKKGYTHFIDSLLNHPKITLSTSCQFDHQMMKSFSFCFLSMSIDEYYGYSEGVLPYRSIRFHTRTLPLDECETPWSENQRDEFSVVNFTDDSPFTRETAWGRLPLHIVKDQGYRTFTKEEPCSFDENDFERYYPFKTSDGKAVAVYTRYKAIADAESNKLMFIGRCGTYQYLDMDQVINQSMIGAIKWLKERA